MKRTQKFLMDNNKSFIVLKRGEWNNSQMFCPICEFVMTSYSDYEAYEEYACCKECFLKFVESRKKKWKEGWRPKREEIDRYKDYTRCHPPSFILS
jgi:ubiquitin C-terminal hydrolase